MTTSAIILLVFLLVLSFGISTILYVSKRENTNTIRHFNLMAGWGLFVYIAFAFVTLLCIIDVVPNGG